MFISAFSAAFLGDLSGKHLNSDFTRIHECCCEDSLQGNWFR